MKGGYTLNDESIKEAYELLKKRGISDDTLLVKKNFTDILGAATRTTKATGEQNRAFDLVTMITTEEVFKGKTVGDLKDMKLEKEDVKMYQHFENTFFLEPEALDMFLQFGIEALTTLQSKIPEGKLTEKENNTVKYTLLILDQLQNDLREKGGKPSPALTVAGKKKSRVLRSRRRNKGSKGPSLKLKTQKKKKGSKSSKKMKQMGGFLGDIISWFYPSPSAKKDADKKMNSIGNIFQRATNRILGRQQMPKDLPFYHREIISILSDKHRQNFIKLIKEYIKANRPVGKQEFSDTFTGNAVAKEILKRIITEIEKEVEEKGEGADEEDKSVAAKLAEIRNRNKPTKEELDKIERDATEVFNRLIEQEANQLFEKYYVKGKDFEEEEQKIIKAAERKEGISSIVSTINMNFYKMLIGMIIIMLNNYPEALTTMAEEAEQKIGLEDSPLQDTVGFLLQFRTLLIFIGGFVAFSKYIIPTSLGQSGPIVNIVSSVNTGFWTLAYLSQDTWDEAKEKCESQGPECFPNLEYDYLNVKTGLFSGDAYTEQASIYMKNTVYIIANFFLRFVEIILDNIDNYGSVIVIILCMALITISANHIKNNTGKLADASENVRDVHREAVKEAAFKLGDMNQYVQDTQEGPRGGKAVSAAQTQAVGALERVQKVIETEARAAREELNTVIQSEIANAQKKGIELQQASQEATESQKVNSLLPSAPVDRQSVQTPKGFLTDKTNKSDFRPEDLVFAERLKKLREETPTAETPTAETSTAETTTAETPTAETTTAETPTAETSNEEIIFDPKQLKKLRDEQRKREKAARLKLMNPNSSKNMTPGGINLVDINGIKYWNGNQAYPAVPEGWEYKKDFFEGIFYVKNGVRAFTWPKNTKAKELTEEKQAEVLRNTTLSNKPLNKKTQTKPKTKKKSTSSKLVLESNPPRGPVTA